MIEYDKLQKSLKHLQLQFENYRTFDSSQPKLLQEAVAESVIQRFEICYDCMWKVLKRYLIEGLGIPEVPDSPKPVFRMAFENNLFSAPIEQWLEFADARTSTANDYSGEEAKAALELMSGFISNAIDLYQTISGEPWQ